MLKQLIGVGLVLSLAGSALAATPKAEWVQVGEGSAGVYLVSAAGVSREGDIVSGVYRIDLKKPRATKSGAAYEAVTTVVKVDCAQRRLQRQSATFSDGRGQVVETQAKGRWREVRAVSPEAAVLDSLCNRNSGKSKSAPKKPPVVAESPTFGTAWASDKGYLVTASHVVAGGGTIALFQDGKKVGEAQVVADDRKNDVALLRYLPPRGAKLTTIPLADKPPVLGRSVFTLGFPAPDVMGQAVKLSRGDIAGMSGVQDDARFLQISIPIQQGNSGGPVVGFDGAAVGVVSSKLTRFSGDKDALRPENVNYAVKVAYVKPLLEKLPDLADYTPIKASGASPEALIAQVSQAVFMVVVSP